MSDQLLDQLDAVYANARRLVAGIGDDQWELPTPCTEWNVRELVNHMGDTSRVMAASAGRGTVDVEPDHRHVGNDAADDLARLGEAAVMAWRAPGALDGAVEIPTEMPASVALSINVLDIGIHGWDLAAATGQDHGMSAESIAAIDERNRALIDEKVRSYAGFGERLDSADDEPLTTMLAFVGRRA